MLYCTVGRLVSRFPQDDFDVHAIVSAHQPRGTVKAWAAETTPGRARRRESSSR